ncbi:MAG: PKD domain-containing protein [Gammaproteobacteria bacterium]|nr:MAG: PKD domain-containing protein [Gammaproteobacteria bacterium]
MSFLYLQKVGLCLITLILSSPALSLSPPSSSSGSCGSSTSKPVSSSSITSSSAALSCHVSVASRWASGYQVEVKVSNPGTTAVTNWSVILDVPPGDSFLSAWNAATLSQAASSYTFGNLVWNKQIPPKGSVSFGANLNGKGTPTCRVVGQTSNNAPLADFTAKVVDDTVHFESIATDPDGDKLTTTFDFGDGKSLKYKDVWHTYKTPGSYTVTQTVSDGKLTTKAVHTIVVGASGVNHAPNAMFSYYTSGLRVTVNAKASTDIDGESLTYTWDFGSGATIPYTDPLTSGYVENGGGYVTLTVFDGKLGNTRQVWASGNPCLTTDPAPSPIINSVTDNLKLSLDASESSNADSFTWDFGDGATGTGMFATHVYTSAGTYTVMLKATGQMMSATKSITVVVGGGITNLPPVASLKCHGYTQHADDFVNYVSTITFFAICDATTSSDPEGAPLSYGIEWGDGSPRQTSTTGNFSHSYKTRGITVPITLSVSDGVNGSFKTIDFKTIEPTIPSPVAVLKCTEGVIVADDFEHGVASYFYTTSCDASGSSDPEGRPLSYQLSWGDNVVETSTTGKFYHNYAVAGDYNLTLLVSNGATSTYETKLWPAHAYSSVNKPPVACFDLTETSNGIALSAACSSDPNGDSLTYVWEFGDAYRGAGVSVEHTYFLKGPYAISLTVSDGKTYSTTTKSYEFLGPKKTTRCEYKIVSSWNGGFQGDLTVYNDGTTETNGWETLLTFPENETISSLFNGVVSGTNPYTVTNAAWNGKIPPGGKAVTGMLVWKSNVSLPNVLPTLSGPSCQ